MANNCLVTKLKASVNNEDLVKLNEFKVKAENGSATIRVAFINTGNTVTTISNGVETAVDGSVYSVADAELITRAPLFTLAEGDYLSAINKYNISALQITSNIKKLSDFNIDYFPNLVALNTVDTVNVNDIKNVNNNMMSLDASILSGNMSNFVAKFPNVTAIYSTNAKNLTCSLDDLAGLSNLKSITLLNLIFDGDNSIESLVSKYRTNGRTTGSMTRVTLSVTFQGNAIPGSSSISWTSDSITVNGTTIEA